MESEECGHEASSRISGNQRSVGMRPAVGYQGIREVWA